MLQLPTPWLAPAAVRPGTKLRLFCLPSAGGGALQYRRWQSSFGEEVEICPIQFPGRENRIGEPCIRRISKLVEVMTQALMPGLEEMPFAIFGHSMGALIAFEWAHFLRSRNLPLPAALYVSGRRAPGEGAEPVAWCDLPDDLFLRELKAQYAGIPSELEESPEVMEYYLPILRADIELIESYKYAPRPPLELPILAFAGMEDSSVRFSDLTDWQSHTTGRFAVKIFPGGHFYDQTQLCASVARHLQSWLALRSNG